MTPHGPLQPWLTMHQWSCFSCVKGNEAILFINGICTGFLIHHSFPVPDGMKWKFSPSSWIILLLAWLYWTDMTETLISAKTQEPNLGMSHHFLWQRLPTKFPIRSGIFKAGTVQYISQIVCFPLLWKLSERLSTAHWDWSLSVFASKAWRHL